MEDENMKATGIVRRIDDLGRVVIPKEIRRTMRINEGNPLEIFTDENQVIFQKYSVIENMATVVKDMLDVLYRTYKAPIIACDKEKVIVAKGISKEEIINRRITDDLTQIMERRSIYAYDGNDNTFCFPIEKVESYAVACAPVIASGDVAGAILFISKDKDPAEPASDIQIALVQSFAAYLGEQLSE